jgi:hypothetical protein
MNETDAMIYFLTFLFWAAVAFMVASALSIWIFLRKNIRKVDNGPKK